MAEIKAGEVGAVDVMQYPFTPEQIERFYGSYEMDLMINSLLKHVPREAFTQGNCSVEEFIQRMDDAGVAKVFVCACKFYSYTRHEPGLMWTNEEVYNIVKGHQDRLVGIAGYDPFNISKSLEELDVAVKEWGFKGVYGHFMTFGCAPNDRRMYPLYAKAGELGVPVAMQLGHGMELYPNEPGRPIYLDQCALDFPQTNFIGSHTGWPWTEEMEAMAWKHPNVYVDIAGHNPQYLAPNIINFMNTRGADKTLFGSNGWPWKTLFKQLDDMNMKDKALKKVLRENAYKLYKLDQ